MYWLISIAISFSFIYSFKLVGSFNSGILVILLSPFLIILHNKSFDIFMRILKSKFFITALLINIAIVTYAIIVPILKSTYDFTFLSPLIGNTASLFATAAIVALFIPACRNKDISDLIVYTLLLQSLIIYLMMFIPELRDIVQSHTLNDWQRDVMASYGGIRGLGLSGSAAFGLSVTMGVQGLVLHYWFNVRAYKIPSFLKIFIFLFAFVASISAGRTAVLGYAVGFIFYFVKYSSRRIIKSIFKYSLFLLLIIIVLFVYINTDPFLSEIFMLYSNYAFQFYWNWLDGHGFEVSSLQSLERMYFLPPNENWLFGDGYYTSNSGDYYMSTDAGYMRYLLLFGVVGSLFFYLGFLFISFVLYINIKKFRLASVLVFLLILMGFIFHYKGDVVLYNIGFMRLFYLIALFCIGSLSGSIPLYESAGRLR